MNILNELPYDIQNIILSKIRNPQNKELLEDIKNFKNNKDIIFKIY